MAKPDPDLILSAQSGDPVALGRLLTQCQTDARRYAKRHCTTSDIDDAVQEALLILAQKVKTLRSVAALTGWLFTIVRHECQRLSRRMFGHAQTQESRAEEKLARRPDEALRIDLLAALESLPAQYLEVILLRDFEGLTIAEITDRIDTTKPGTKSRLHRARELVREYLLTSVDMEPARRSS